MAPFTTLIARLQPGGSWSWVRRAYRVARLGGITVAIYGAGKTAGHIEVLADPDGMRRQLVHSFVERSFDPGERRTMTPAVHDEWSALHRRVSSVGARIVVAAREHVAAQRSELRRRIAQLAREAQLASDAPPSSQAARAAEDADEARAQDAYWAAAERRLSGQWQWVVTNSQAVNAFVTPYCPRCVFVLEGLLTQLQPTDDELAMVIAHELAHQLHDHGSRTLQHGVEGALLQLLVLSLLDPTGLLELAVSATMQLGSYVSRRQFDRECEAEADATGLDIVTRACFDPVAAARMMSKFVELDPDRSSAWLRSHPLAATRLKRLLSQSGRIEADARAREHCAHEQLDLRAALRALYERSAPPTVAPSAPRGS